jgi:diguanylate cyclase (GGDEF)-like protein
MIPWVRSKRILTEIVRSVAAQSRLLILAEALLLTVVLGAADVWTGSEFSFSIFYLMPITLVAWTLGRRPALSIAVFASVIWLWADYAAGHVYSHPLIPYWNASVRLGYFTLFAVLFARLHETLDRERDLSRVDPLTGVQNRRAFEEFAGREVERAVRYARPMSLAFIDVDHFKQVNDRFGHRVGDELLSEIAATLISTLRSTDIIARLGGDEFAVLMPETDSQAAVAALEKSRGALNVRMQSNSWPVTFSMGVVSAEGPLSSLPELLAAADRLMYEAKRTGRDRIVQSADLGVEVPGDSGST